MWCGSGSGSGIGSGSGMSHKSHETWERAARI